MNEETGKLTFEAFYSIAANFLEDEDDEAMQVETNATRKRRIKINFI